MRSNLENSSNAESGERIICNFGVGAAQNSLTEFPAITTIESEEDSNLSNFVTKDISVLKKVTAEEDSNNVLGTCDTDLRNEEKDILGGGKHLPPKELHQDSTKGPDAAVSVTKPMNSSSKLIQESGAEIQSLPTEDKTATHALVDKEPKYHKSKTATAVDETPQELNDGTGVRERAKPKKVKMLSFLEDPSPKGLEDAATHFGTPMAREHESDLSADLSKIPPSTYRARGRTSKRANGKSKRSQTPAAPPINLADYGSDDDIAADLVETVHVHSETPGRKAAKSWPRNARPSEARSISNPRERSAMRDSSTPKTHVPMQDNAERASTRARVTFELPGSSDVNVAGQAPKPKCHTPFPRDTIDLLAASDSEDSDGIPMECRNKISLSTASSKSVESVQTNDSNWMEDQRSLQSATPFWMSELKEEARECSNVQVPCPSKKVSFTLKPVRTSSTRAAAPSMAKPTQYSSFVRIGRPRNRLTFERGIETLDIPPSLPSLQRPKLVPGSYCCTCGQKVVHL